MPDWVSVVLDLITSGTTWEQILKAAAVVATIGGAAAALGLAYNLVWGRWRRRREEKRAAQAAEQDRRRGVARGRKLDGIDSRLQGLTALVEELAAASASTGSPIPHQAEQIAEAVEAAAEDAEAGDERMARALELLQKGDPEQARPLFRAVAEEKTRLVDKDRREAAAAWRHLGAIAGLADPMQARFAYAQAVELDPTDPESQLSHGWLQLNAGQLVVAHAAFQQVLAAANRDATDRHILWARIGIGDVLRDQGTLAEAVASYRAAMAIAERLAEADPDNAGSQRDLSVSHNRIGDVLLAQGNLSEALASYRAAMAIAQRLAEADPDNAGWQRDLSVSHNKIGDVLRAQGDLSEALASYRAATAIAQRLAEADPDNAVWQRDLALGHGRIAAVKLQQDDRDGALEGFIRGHEIIAALASASPDNATLANDITWFDAQIAALKR